MSISFKLDKIQVKMTMKSWGGFSSVAKCSWLTSGGGGVDIGPLVALMLQS